ncbi:DUF6238 family protein [Streptomyces griseoaurantiacus]|uniref:DUF6238 family protein n=1 Tax=Streptomyces griseoaurantiacus TaxID=68213 RepID=UPI00352CF652
MPHSEQAAGERFVPLATAALDLHRALTVPDGSLVADAIELDNLHAHAVALLFLLDSHAESAGPVRELAAPLRAARIRAWQLAERLHHAAHATPYPPATGRRSLCQRHQAAVRLIRRRTTPADLRT